MSFYLRITFIIVSILVPAGLFYFNFEFPKSRLSISANPFIGYLPLLHVRNYELFDNRALKIIEFPSPRHSLRAFRNEVIDASFISLEDAMQLKSEGIDLRVLAVVNISNGGIALIGRPGLTNVSQLKSRAVGFEKSGLTSYFLSRALKNVNLDLDDVRLHGIEVAYHEREFLSGKIDAVLTREPYKTRLLKLGGHLLIDSRSLPGEIMRVIVVHRSSYEAKKESVEEFLSTWNKGIQEMRKKDKVSIQQIQKYFSVSDEEAQNMLSSVQILNTEESDELLRSLQFKVSVKQKAQNMIYAGLLDNDLNLINLEQGLW